MPAEYLTGLPRKRSTTMDNILIQQFSDAIFDCRRIYVDNAVESVTYSSGLEADSKISFMDETERLFDRLIIKVFVEVSFSDCIWSQGEAQLAKVIAEQLLREPVSDKELVTMIKKMQQISSEDSWQDVLEPFMLLDDLREHRAELEAGLMKMANIVAKIDGNVTHETIGQLKNLRWQLHQFIKPVDEPITLTVAKEPVSDVEADEVMDLKSKLNSNSQSATALESADVQTQQSVDAESESASTTTVESVLEELDQLVGIDSVKEEVRGLVNFLRVQKHRKDAGLPENKISMHMVFEGNPGTGKTTVARILGRLFGAIGVLDKGHLVETDRSGLVAEFVGQTAVKTNKIIDEALDGILFIDEAYSLVSDGKDAFGNEALQILLKRAEDDRDRLIVILAGYPEPMKRLLLTNPGLSSRFNRTIAFPDYTPEELVGIFEIFANQNHYVIRDDVRQRILDIATGASRSRDEHFGNGRLMRNVFENAMRNLADRVVDVAELTPDLLTTFEAEDITCE